VTYTLHSSEASLLDFSQKLEYPTSPSGVYALGISVENMILRSLLQLMKHRQDFNEHKFLNQIFSYHIKEAELLQKTHGYELNAEVGRFYASGGTAVETEIRQEDLSRNLSIIEQTLGYFTAQVETIIDSMGSAEEILKACLELRRQAADLFHHLALLYPEGSLRNCLEEIAVFISQRSADFYNCHAKVS
jgi:hypothetical protein